LTYKVFADEQTVATERGFLPTWRPLAIKAITVAKTTLQTDLKKKRPFEALEQEATLNLLRTTDQLQIQFSRLFREYGLTSAQYNILRILRGEGKPLPILEIASRTITMVPGITGLIDRLEQGGFVRRERCETDRRVIYVAITQASLDVLARLDQPVIDLHQQLLGHLSKSELAELVRVMEKIREPLAKEG
jgi:DNA-binding MarR family transcriptional regulator